MIFTSNTPLSQHYAAPDYVDNPIEKFRLAMAGYKANGEQTSLGKIQSWIPGANLIRNKIAQKYAKGSDDTLNNIRQDWDNRVSKTAVTAGTAAIALGGLGALGVIGGEGAGAIGAFIGENSSDILSAGLNTTTQFGGQLAFDQNDLITEGQAIYR